MDGQSTETDDAMSRDRDSLRVVACLTVIVLAIYAQAATFRFLNYDDDRCLTANADVLPGLTLEGIEYAFTTGDAGNYFPLTWVSHMAMVEVFDLDPAAHHLANVLLHWFNSVLVFLVWRRMTGKTMASALVAGLFAAHPLAVEVAAWVSERKGCLSAAFFLLSMLAYARYCERPSLKRYGVVAAMFVLALLAKASILTLPCALFLCDLWPLRRHTRGVPSALPRKIGILALEKVPLLLCAVPFLVMAYLTTQAGNTSLVTYEAIPIGARFENAVVSYVAYVAKVVWPFHLAVHYPHPMGGTSPWLVLGAGGILIAVSVAALGSMKRAPYVATGWFWYMGTLSPLIGISQLGTHAMADRYMYIPILGLLTIAVWGGESLARQVGDISGGFHRLAIGAVVALAIVSFFQARHWESSKSLYTHAIAVTAGNSKMHYSLGATYANEREYGPAFEELEEAARISPQNLKYREIAGGVAMATGRIDRAAFHFAAAYRQGERRDESVKRKLEAVAQQSNTPNIAAYIKEAIEGVPVGTYGGFVDGDPARQRPPAPVR